jgi:hypothetical protein
MRIGTAPRSRGRNSVNCAAACAKSPSGAAKQTDGQLNAKLRPHHNCHRPARPGDPVRRGPSAQAQASLEYWITRACAGDDTELARDRATYSMSSWRKPGPITPNADCYAPLERRVPPTTSAAAYGSLLSQGRQWGESGVLITVAACASPPSRTPVPESAPDRRRNAPAAPPWPRVQPRHLRRQSRPAPRGARSVRAGGASRGLRS